MMRPTSFLRILWPLVYGGALFGCDSGPPAPPRPPSKAARGLARLTGGNAAAAKPAPAEASPAAARPTVLNEEEPDIAYAYSPIGKRDPFRSLFEQRQIEVEEQQLTDLQRFELDQLKLVAIVSRIATPYAMVEDPEGKGHSLTRGTLIGKNWGRVSGISADCVTVKEEYRDYTGRKVTNKTDMCLPKPEDLKVD
ncbi:MAG: pilus assembly protein PilP [Myxococcota bacterium]